MAKRKRTAIPNAEWHVTLQLHAGDDNAPIGEPITMVFAETVVRDCADNVDWLIGRRLDEMAPKLRKLCPKTKVTKESVVPS